jgi:alkylation response protein AidB-like acyl-CoA dehydrogenase
MTIQTFKAEQARAAASLRWKAAPKPNGVAEWVKRASEAATILKIDAVERDAAGKPPFAEVQLLKDAGLVNLLGPRQYGGGGETWQTSYKVTTEIAKADASIGHLIGNHYSWYVVLPATSIIHTYCRFQVLEQPNPGYSETG